ncbi:bifunctional protein NCOAT [Anopheles darlingi]|uniref:protein O-GlcNAcase n=1 Tax=Anopheles darlingi TaxID=43151 RepID=W5JTR5_ANODA|nr:bifunctional protein NCOAT [Anopheles darlingi]
MAEVPAEAAGGVQPIVEEEKGDGDVEVPAIGDRSDRSTADAPAEGFICGVVEGFYGRPWTTEQRKDLFRKLKRWGMDAYIYAPKDDYKHRAYWRELYTVEEADHLTGLITAAHEQNINFYYALSPGLDITYSSPKEVAALKRKLDQVSQFGCKAFALLFDDIEPEMSKPDKEVFQSFAFAQVSVTNEIFNHLNCPRFLFCPTQYCSTRAVPTVKQSEYLNTLGTKLVPAIDILWTGPKVISKLLTVECIEEITEVLRRPPVIWDNLHANDYDQKRVFLGPYSGRSPELIPLLRGVVTNPNCEFHANAIAIQTLAFWSKCRGDTSRLASTASEHDIKLETENEDGICQGDAPAFLSENIYHPRLALKNAIANWLPEFFQEKQAWGPITKPQPAVTMVMPILPIIPSVNTCMTLTSTSTTTTTTATALPAMPEVNTNQLQLFADVCSTVTNVAEALPNPIMNSLVSATKVVTNESLPNPVAAAVNNLSLPPTIPISSISLPLLPCIKPADESPADVDVEVKTDAGGTLLESTTQAHVRDEDDSVIRDAEEIDGSSSTTGQQDVLDENEVKMVDATEEPDGDDKMMTVSDDAQLVNHHAGEQLVDASESRSIPLVPPPIPPVVEMIEDDSKTDVAELNVGNSNNNGVVAPEPMECGSNLTSPKHLLKTHFDDVIMSETTSTCSGTMQVESSDTSLEMAEDNKNNPERDITDTDLMLLCDLFYLPFEHGSKALQLLTEFHWLRNNAYVLCRRGVDRKNGSRSSPTVPSSQTAVERPTEDGDITESVGGATDGGGERDDREMIAAKADDAQEWLRRAESFHNLCQAIFTLTGKIARCANKELCYDLFSYVWDVAGVLSLLSGFVRWLALGHFPVNIASYTQGGYTWFSKGWKETFMSGDQEPWVFRGGLVSDLQRLVPIDAGSDLFLYKTPETSAITLYTIRPYAFADEPSLYEICQQTANDGDALVDRPTDGPLVQVVADRYLGPFLTMTPELCLVLEDQSGKAVGYACAVLDTRIFLRNMEQCWVPEMCLKYPLALIEDCDIAEPVVTEPVEPQSSPPASSLPGAPSTGAGGAERTRRMVRDSVRYFHQFQNEYPSSVLTTHPSLLCCRVLNENLLDDETACKRLLTVVLAALRCNGATQGVHVCIDRSDRYLYQFYAKLGFVEIHASDLDATVYLGRNF